MNARDELARVLDEWLDDEAPLNLRRYMPVADAILAAGYSKPRTVSTVEELDALSKGSVVLDAHAEAYQRIDDEGVGGEALWSSGDLVTSSLVVLPATVLYTPKES